MLKKLLEERKYRKKYNSLKIVYDDLLGERDILLNENDILHSEIVKLIRDKNNLNKKNRENTKKR